MNARTVTHKAALSGAERAAVVLLALGEERGRALWESFDDDELRELTRAISKLGAVAPDVVDGLLGEFEEDLARGGAIAGSADAARRLLAGALPSDRASSILEDMATPAGRTMWEKLANVPEETLAGYLKREHPQTVAVILARIAPGHAARVIAALPDRFAEETINRMLSLGPVRKDVLDEIENTLRTEFIASLAERGARDPHEAMAEIFNCFDRATERKFIEILETKDPASAERIKALMFVFEDLAKLAPGDAQTLIRQVDKSKLALALKGADDALREVFFANMSQRAATMLRDDIDIMGPVRLRDVDAAQQEIVAVARDLAEEGDIFLSKQDDDEVIY